MSCGHLCIHTYMCVYIHTCVCMYVYTYIRICIHTYVCVCVSVCLCVYVSVCLCVCVSVLCVCVCVFYVHTYTPPHTDIQPWMYKAPTQTLRKTDTRALPSQATKISTGGLKHEGFLQDAIKFASAVPGLFGGNPSRNSGRAGAAAEAEAIAMGHSSMEPVSLRVGGPDGGWGGGVEGVGEGSPRLASQTLTDIDHGRNQQLAQQTWPYGQDAADAISEPGRPGADGEEPRQPHQASLRLQRLRVNEARGGGYHPRRMRRGRGGSHQVVYQRRRGGGGGAGGGGHTAASPSWWARVWGFVSARGLGGHRGRGRATGGPQDGVGAQHAEAVDSAAL
jgi:hypothetical protein